MYVHWARQQAKAYKDRGNSMLNLSNWLISPTWRAIVFLASVSYYARLHIEEAEPSPTFSLQGVITLWAISSLDEAKLCWRQLLWPPTIITPLVWPQCRSLLWDEASPQCFCFRNKIIIISGRRLKREACCPIKLMGSSKQRHKLTSRYILVSLKNNNLDSPLWLLIRP